MTKGKLVEGRKKLGGTEWYLIDEQGNLLNTEIVCWTPDERWHPWFVNMLRNLEIDYPFDLRKKLISPNILPTEHSLEGQME